MIRRRRIVLLLVVIFTTAVAHADWLSRSGLFHVQFRSDLDPLVINRIHNWTLHVEDEKGKPVSGASIAVDGGMPAHDHGLPTAPRVTRELGDGDYLLEGMRFHMNGHWEIEITIEAGARRDVVVIPLEL